MPAAQSTQFPLKPRLYFPAGHTRQAGVSGASSGSRSKPALQMHSVMLAVPEASVCESGMHAVQVVCENCAVRFEYSSCGHSAQAVSDEVVFCSSDSSLYLPSGHAVQETSPLASAPEP